MIDGAEPVKPGEQLRVTKRALRRNCSSASNVAGHISLTIGDGKPVPRTT